jgi:hypothetical protein
VKRLTVGVAAALTLFSGAAAACEWHEMTAYGYGPQRYSPFARAPIEEPPAEERSAEQGRNGDSQPTQPQSAQSGRDTVAEERDEAAASESDRAESVLAARR